METLCNLLGNSSHRLGGGVVLTLQGLYWNPQGSISPSAGAVPTMQMHCNESKAYAGQRQKRTHVLHVWLLICQVQGLGSHRVRMLSSQAYNVQLFFVLFLKSLFLPPAHSSLSYSPSKTWDSAFGHSFHCSSLASTQQYDQCQVQPVEIVTMLEAV